MMRSTVTGNHWCIHNRHWKLQHNKCDDSSDQKLQNVSSWLTEWHCSAHRRWAWPGPRWWWCSILTSTLPVCSPRPLRVWSAPNGSGPARARSWGACPCAPVSSKAQQDARTQIHTRSLARAHTHTYTHSLASLVPSTGRYSAVEAVAFIWKLGFCGVPWKAWERESILGRVLSLPIISASVPRRS